MQQNFLFSVLIEFFVLISMVQSVFHPPYGFGDMKLQRWSKSGDVIGLSVLKGLVEKTKDSAVIAMDAMQVTS